ncbi:putative short-chain dehydrogenase [Coleophoma cylindrospora]|uniref:Putative short-chain dehydrogenase n=1 Tax=Coleophoma cylindrospora TaxID=1849047 RepID=A0A3D8QPL9_9HELO|nr:putative short-chain dehydrogenase [Coleophoma cylindrospora]
MSYVIPFLHRQLFVKLPEPTASFQGKTVIVTGSNVGLGLEASRWLVRLGASRVILACRNLSKGQAAAKDIQTTTGCSSDTIGVWQLDMGSYASVQAFAAKVKAELPRLDVLIANAGINSHIFNLAEDNEAMVTVNVVSLFLLGFLLYPKLRETAKQYNTETHFTITSSDLHEVASFKEHEAPPGQIFATLNDKTKFPWMDRYPTSKLLEILMVKQMATLSPHDTNRVIVNCVSPGMCQSELTREFSNFLVRLIQKVLGRTTEVGSRTIVYGASFGAESHGKYIPDCKIEAPRGICQRDNAGEIQTKVWAELKDKLETIQRGVTTLSA